MSFPCLGYQGSIWRPSNHNTKTFSSRKALCMEKRMFGLTGSSAQLGLMVRLTTSQRKTPLSLSSPKPQDRGLLGERTIRRECVYTHALEACLQALFFARGLQHPEHKGPDPDGFEIQPGQLTNLVNPGPVMFTDHTEQQFLG